MPIRTASLTKRISENGQALHRAHAHAIAAGGRHAVAHRLLTQLVHVGLAGDEDDNQVMRCADHPSEDDAGPGDAGGSMAISWDKMMASVPFKVAP